MPLMPVALVDTSNTNGVQFTRLPITHDHLKVDTELILYNAVGDTLYKSRLIVTELANNSGAAQVIEEIIPEDWPQHLDPKGSGNPLYIADGMSGFEPSYAPDLWIKNPAQYHMLLELAKEHMENTGIEPAFGVPKQLIRRDQMEFPD